MSYPPISAAELRAQATFTALLWAFGHPGRARTLTDDAFAVIAACLLDLETSFYCSDAELHLRLALTGARPAAPDAAQYHFYPELRARDLAVLRDAPTGSYLYPDTGATLVIGGRLDRGQQLALTGPGIAQRELVTVDGVPQEFWALRETAIRYPQGWDIVLVDGERIVGLPRTTTVEVL